MTDERNILFYRKTLFTNDVSFRTLMCLTGVRYVYIHPFKPLSQLQYKKQHATRKAAKACKLQQNPITSARQQATNPARLAQLLQTLLA